LNEQSSLKGKGTKTFIFESDKSEAVGFLMMFEGSVEHPAQVHLIAVKIRFPQKRNRQEADSKSFTIWQSC
jgi:hypothetical protein